MSPLSGMTVIEAGSYIAVPYAGMMLADMGAEVIKVERPGGGDPFRRFDGDTYRPFFRALNRSKKSVVVDLQTPGGRAIFRRLAEKADLIIENNRNGVMDKLGLGYDDLCKDNPRLVYCSVTGFGTSGPYSDRPSFDTVGQAMSGLLSMYVDPENPRLAGTGISDQVTALYACYASLSGLMQRERSGKGCRVETSMVAAGMSFCEMWFTSYYADRTVPDMYRRSAVSQSFALRTSDAKLLIIHLSSLPKFWESLLKAIQAPGLAEDPRFATRPDRIRNYEVLRVVLGEIFARQSRSHWMDALAEHGVPFSPIYGFDEVASDPQVAHMDLFHELQHPRGPATTALKRPVRIDGQTGFEQAYAPPLLGEHTREVLQSIGYSGMQMDELEKSGVIAPSE